MGFLPPQVWALTPRDTALLIAGWNDAHDDGALRLPSEEEVAALMERYPDE